MQFLNERTGELVGDLADISPNGFRLEGSKPVPVGTEFAFRVEVPPEISQKSSIVFAARSRWSQQDPVDGRLYEAGFEITKIDAGDSRAFEGIFDRCGSTSAGKDMKTDYLWKV